MFCHEVKKLADGRPLLSAGPLPIERAGIDQESRAVKFVLTEEIRDRARFGRRGQADGDIVRVKGIDFRDYQRNPVLLVNHNYGGETLPIGTVEGLTRDRNDSRLVGVARYAPEGTYALADTAFGLTVANVLRAFSIGFVAIKSQLLPSEDEEDGGYAYQPRDFVKSHLLETSTVAVPMNQNALRTNSFERDLEYIARDTLLANRRAGVSEERIRAIVTNVVAILEPALARVLDGSSPDETAEPEEDGAKPTEETGGDPGGGEVATPEEEARVASLDELVEMITSRLATTTS